MAGNGPPPSARKVRRNKEAIPQTVLRFEHAEAPELPEGVDWPERTRQWWATWKASPQAEHFGSTDWDYLLDTALVHARLWSGDLSAAAELRLRVAAFGATPADRARLRMVFAEADGADGGRGSSGGQSARERYGQLRMMPGGKERAVESG